MYKFKDVTKSSWLSIVSAALTCFIGVPLASAGSYTYNLTNPSGFITTNCDNCVLNSSNIIGWSMSVPGFITLSSTTPGARLSVTAGDPDMSATPEGINFYFDSPFGGSYLFATPSAFVDYEDVGPSGNIGFGPGAGILAACNAAGTCMWIGGGSAASIATAAVPFAGSVTYAFTGMVTSATGIYASAGSTVTGTFTIEFAGGDGALPVSFTRPWSSFSAGSSPVVRSTLKSGGVMFNDAGSTGNMTSVAGYATAGSGLPNEYLANDTKFSGVSDSVDHTLQLIGGTGASAPFDANGLPVFPNATGGATGTLNAYSAANFDNAATGQLNYTLTSLTPVPTVSLAPLSLSFPSTAVGSVSAPMTVTLKNTSAEGVSISSITLAGVQTNNFALTHTCGASLAVDASCTVSVTFKPVAAGAKRATFTVMDNARVSQRSVTLSGTATAVPAPALKLSALSLSFADQQVATASAAQTVTLTNTGTATLLISSIAVTGVQADDFTLAKNCGSSLAVGASCALSVAFNPVAAGAKTAMVFIADNAHGSQRTVALTGTGR